MNTFSLFSYRACYRSRQGLCALALFGHFVAVIGIPILTTKSDTRPSCEGAACGCSEELKARNECCCHRPAQPKQSAPRACCKVDAIKDAEPPKATPEPRTIRWMAGVMAQRCCSEDGPLALQNGEPLFYCAAVVDSHAKREHSDRLAIMSEMLLIRPLDPPIPPPRLG